MNILDQWDTSKGGSTMGLIFDGIDLKQNYKFVTTKVDGRGSPPISTVGLEMPRVDGKIELSRKLQSRKIVITGYVYGKDSSEALTNKDNLIKLISKAYSQETKLEFPDTNKYIYVKLSGEPLVIGPVGPTFNAVAYELTFTFEALDPLFYGEDFSEELIGVSKVQFDAKIPLESPIRRYKNPGVNLKLQPYTILDHLGSYGLEGYGVYPNPNSYGLHDDGTNIFTVRSDDLPFSDVDYAFAVEEGTMNLLTNGGFDDGTITGWQPATGTISYNANVLTGEFSSYMLQFDSNGNPWSGLVQLLSVTGGTTYTLHAKVKAKDSNSVGKEARLRLLEKDTNGTIIIYNYDTFSLPADWEHRVFTITLDTSTTDIEVGFQINDATAVMLIDNIQLEQKPFATSFVDSADSPRAVGIVNLGDILQSFTNKSVILATWIKVNAINNSYPRIFDIRNSDASHYIDLGIDQDFSTIDVLDTEITSIDLNIWYLVGLIITPDDVTGFVVKNGVIYKTTKTSINSSILNDVILRMGNHSGTGRELNGFISNLYIGTYDPDVWTDTFVQELYNKQVLAKALKQIEKSPTPPSALQNKYGITKMGELLLQDPDLFQYWFSKYNFSKKALSAGYEWGV